MEKKHLLILVIMFGSLVSCIKLPSNKATGQEKTNPQVDSTEIIASQEKERINDSIKEAELKEITDLIEKDFFNDIKGVDREYGESNYPKFQKILKKHKASSFDLYLELTNIFKTSKEEAIQKAVNSGMQERKYVEFIDKIREPKVEKFKQKYEIDNRLYVCFVNNYCSCVGDNSDKYCPKVKEVLPNYEYWKGY